MFKGLKSIIRIFFLALITVGIGIIYIKTNYSKALETPNSENTDKIEFTIDQGETVEQILTKLVEAELLNEKWTNYVKYYIRAEELASNIQAGTYEIPMNLNIKELINTFQNGQNPSQWVTIPEGLRKDEIAETLSLELDSAFSSTSFLALTTDTTYISKLGLPKEVTDLEGYIFPDKYSFELESTAEEVLTIMVENFKTKIGTEDSYDDIIIASIVEREGYTATDRPIVAGVIIKRLEEGWLLQTDATLLYPVKDWKHVITVQDKEDDNPYNTYKKAGLPPTPICNPGLEAIKAVRNPVETNYYYYIHANDGTPYFAETLAEHNANVQQYLR